MESKKCPTNSMPGKQPRHYFELYSQLQAEQKREEDMSTRVRLRVPESMSNIFDALQRAESEMRGSR